jgi:hypothetical protein
MRLALCAFVTALAALGSAPAAAATFSAGTLSTTPYIIPDQFVLPSASFDDLLTFSTLASPVSSVVSNISFTFPGGGFGISPFSAMLYAGSTGTGAGTLVASGGSTLNLTPGDYSIRFTGTATGASGGLWSASVSAPVPEPHEWAMMLAGLGLVGFAASRKHRDSRMPVAAA